MDREELIASFSREDPRWWLLDTSLNNAEGISESWKKIMRLVRKLDQDLETEKVRMMRCQRIYDPTSTIIGVQYDLRTGPYPYEPRAPVTMNVSQSAVDTVTALIAQHQVMASYQTDGADWTQMMHAQDMERAMEGEFQRTDLYEYIPMAFKDSGVVGQGIIKPYEDEFTGMPALDLVPWDAIVIDQAEWMNGKGRQIHEVRFIDRSLLIEMYPKHREAIQNYSTRDVTRWWTTWRQPESDMVPIVESWHLRSGPDAKDGVYARSIDGCNLEWSEYKWDEFPHEILYWERRPNGFFGRGLVESGAGIQNRINKINLHIAKCHDLSNTYVVVQAIDAALRIKLSGGNQPLQLLPYRGTERPTFETPAAVPPELYQHLVFLIEQYYNLAGISKMSATSERPEGIESAIALETVSDMQSQRFSGQQQRCERVVCNIARKFGRILSEAEGTPEAMWRRGPIVKRIPWKKVMLEEKAYVISVQPASIMSRTPAGKLQAAITMANAGLWTKDEIRRLIGHPDTKQQMDVSNAGQDHGFWLVEYLTNTGPRACDIFDEPAVVAPIVAAGLKRMIDAGAPEEILQRFRDFLQSAQVVMAKSQPPPQPGPAPQLGAGPAAPPPGPPPAQLQLPPGGGMPPQ